MYIQIIDDNPKIAKVHMDAGYSYDIEDPVGVMISEVLKEYNFPLGNTVYEDIVKRFVKIARSSNGGESNNILHRLFTYILYRTTTINRESPKANDNLYLVDRLLNDLQPLTMSRRLFIKERTPSRLPKSATIRTDMLEQWVAYYRYRGIFIDITGIAPAATDYLVVTYVDKPLDIENLYNEDDF